jgi:transcriptional regulator with XRE-family HTH domain
MLEDVGRNIRRIRRDRDLAQGVIARLAGIRQQELSAIERGLQPKLALVDRLARVLGVHPNELLRDATDSHEREQQQREPAGTAA